MAGLEISADYLTGFLEDLLKTPSPTGDSEYAIGLVQAELESFGIRTERTRKGALLAHLDGLRDDCPRAVTAHVDTLGAMVQRIKPNGRLQLTALNGLVWPTVESEGVTVATRSGRSIRGSLVFANGAAHVNRDVYKGERTSESLEVRLDERTLSPEETRLLGVEVGDFVYFDPRYETGDAGFIRSRFLDDKACVACAVAALKTFAEANISAQQRTTFLISNFEEVGHGGIDGLPPDLAELLVLDMACIGNGLNGDEFHCSICVKDSSGPYSKELGDKLRSLADRTGVDLKADVYPFYSSDGSVYWRAGGQAQVALIGPGVDTSHGYERTHTDALVDTCRLLCAYLLSE
jgi:putative aminopeptidase FrvX